jgi:hypothetical protein
MERREKANGGNGNGATDNGVMTNGVVGTRRQRR